MCAGSPRLRSAPDRRPIVQPLAHRTRSPGIHGARRPVRTRAASRCHAPGHRRTLQLNALPAAPTCTPLSASFVTPQRIRTGPDHRCREDHERTRRYIHTDHHGESHYGTAPSSPSGRTQTRPSAGADERVVACGGGAENRTPVHDSPLGSISRLSHILAFGQGDTV